MYTTFRLFAGAVLAVLFLTSCNGDDPPVPGLYSIKGFVIADDPVVGATVQMVDSSGAPVVGVPTARTNENGVFAISTNIVPSSFVLMTNGGTYRGKPLSGSMKSMQGSDFKPERNIVYVTPVSSLVTAHSRGASREQSETKVKQFLGLAPSVKLQKMKKFRPTVFSGRAFMDRALNFSSASGAGFDAYVSSLLPQIDAGGRLALNARVPQTAAAETNAGLQLLSWAGSNLASGAVGAVGAKLFTTLLDEVNPPAVELSDVQSHLDQIQTELANFETENEQGLAAINCSVTTGTYQTFVGTFLTQVSAVESIQAYMDLLASQSGDARDATKDNIKKLVAANLDLHKTMSTLAMGNPKLQIDGAVTLLSRELYNCGWFFNEKKSQILAQQFNYLSSLITSACQAVLSYQISDKDTAGASTTQQLCNTPTGSTGYVQVFQKFATDALSSGVVIDTRSNQAWWLYYGFVAANYQYGDGYWGIYSLKNFVPPPGFDWQRPGMRSMTQALKGCTNTTTAGVQKCLADQGWGTWTGTSNTAFATGDDLYIWTVSSGDAYGSDLLQDWPWLSINSPDFRAVINWTGYYYRVNCPCNAHLAAVATPPDGKHYWWTTSPLASTP